VAALGAHASLAGLVGDDSAGDRVLEECGKAQVDTRAVRRSVGRPTTRKLRVLAHNQQIVRLDWESTDSCEEKTARWMLDRLAERRRPDIAVLSDYAKGVLSGTSQAIIEALRYWHIPVVVDPKQRNLEVYRGASVVTPNLGELIVATGRRLKADDAEGIAAAAQSLVISAGLGAMVVTCGDRGMIVAWPDRPPLRVAAQGRVLHDSIGAGDTAVATLATALAAGAGLDLAAQIANAAAGISVSRVGTTAVHPHEIEEVVGGIGATKILHIDDLVPLVERWRSDGQRIVFANGCFDLFHAGHLSLLQNAARFGNRLVVAINSDASVTRLKGEHRPVVAGPERAALVAALACVDAVTMYDDDTPLQTIVALRPDVLVKGRDYSIDQVVGRDFVEANGGRVELVALAPEQSTSRLIDRIAHKWGTV
jgi:D-beta-D-heptose 7-phosphate kinase/D-beta-D-heptose 1-phosphate adenosyltransferase